jgi:hypothetical protein
MMTCPTIIAQCHSLYLEVFMINSRWQMGAKLCKMELEEIELSTWKSQTLKYQQSSGTIITPLISVRQVKAIPQVETLT